jgi:hypothetical protein
MDMEEMDENINDGVRNRKRGKGKIKITKRQHVNNKELVQELIDFKATIEKQREQKDKEVFKILEEKRKIEDELERLNNLKRPSKKKIEQFEIELTKINKKLEARQAKECCGQASERLGEIFIDLVENYATKSNFSGYTYLEEMKSRAIFFLLRYSPSFNPEKSKNAFAYCTQIVKNAFIQVIKKEKKRSEAKKQFVEDYYRNKDFTRKDDDLFFGNT